MKKVEYIEEAHKLVLSIPQQFRGEVLKRAQMPPSVIAAYATGDTDGSPPMNVTQSTLVTEEASTHIGDIRRRTCISGTETPAVELYLRYKRAVMADARNGAKPFRKGESTDGVKFTLEERATLYHWKTQYRARAWKKLKGGLGAGVTISTVPDLGIAVVEAAGHDNGATTYVTPAGVVHSVIAVLPYYEETQVFFRSAKVFSKLPTEQMGILLNLPTVRMDKVPKSYLMVCLVHELVAKSHLAYLLATRAEQDARYPAVTPVPTEA
jgi:hypothetical protein